MKYPGSLKSARLPSGINAPMPNPYMAPADWSLDRPWLGVAGVSSTTTTTTTTRTKANV